MTPCDLLTRCLVLALLLGTGLVGQASPAAEDDADDGFGLAEDGGDDGAGGFSVFGSETEEDADDAQQSPDGEATERDAREAEGDADNAPAAEARPLAPVRKVGNREALTALRRYAEQQGWPVTVHGEGPFRIMTFGREPLEVDKLVADSELTLQGLEIWTGKQQLFVHEDQDESRVLHFAWLPNDRAFDGFVDWARKRGLLSRPEGEDLTKHTNNAWLPRVAISEVDKISRGNIHRNVNVYLTTGLALRTFFQERAPEGEKTLAKWLVVGMQSELEKRVCGNNRCYTISYEKSSTDLAQGDWGRQLSNLIKRRSDHLLRADDVMMLEMISLTAEDYLQVWSLSAFIRQALGTGGEERPGFGDLLDGIARGADSINAVHAHLGTDNRELTNTWLRWALRQR